MVAYYQSCNSRPSVRSKTGPAPRALAAARPIRVKKVKGPAPPALAAPRPISDSTQDNGTLFREDQQHWGSPLMFHGPRYEGLLGKDTGAYAQFPSERWNNAIQSPDISFSRENTVLMERYFLPREDVQREIFKESPQRMSFNRRASADDGSLERPLMVSSHPKVGTFDILPQTGVELKNYARREADTQTENLRSLSRTKVADKIILSSARMQSPTKRPLRRTLASRMTIAPTGGVKKCSPFSPNRSLEEFLSPSLTVLNEQAKRVQDDINNLSCICFIDFFFLHLFQHLNVLTRAV